MASGYQIMSSHFQSKQSQVSLTTLLSTSFYRSRGSLRRLIRAPSSQTVSTLLSGRIKIPLSSPAPTSSLFSSEAQEGLKSSCSGPGLATEMVSRFQTDPEICLCPCLSLWSDQAKHIRYGNDPLIVSEEGNLCAPQRQLGHHPISHTSH